MLHADARFADAVEAAVTRWETQTDAEIVVVAAGRSGSYADLVLVSASVGALLVGVLLELVPYPINAWLLLLDLALAWGALAWILNGVWFVRLLAPRARRLRQVARAAQAEFVIEQVHATPDRTGVLIYVSALEGRVEVLPDVGLQGRIPKAVLDQAIGSFDHEALPGFLEGLDALGAVLAEHIPKLEVDLVDLPNAPRVRP